MSNLTRILICIITFGLFLYVYIEKLNAHTELKLKIPALVREINKIDEEAVHLSYEIECFKSPAHLLELSKQPEYSHLKFPFLEDILIVPTGLAKQANTVAEDTEIVQMYEGLKLPIILGIKH